MSGCCREDLDSSSFRAASLEVVRERMLTRDGGLKICTVQEEKAGSAEMCRAARETTWSEAAWLSSGTYVRGLPPRCNTARCCSEERSMMGAARPLLDSDRVCRFVRFLSESAR